MDYVKKLCAFVTEQGSTPMLWGDVLLGFPQLASEDVYKRQLSETERVCSSVNVGSTKCGIDMDAVRLIGEMILETAERTKEQDSLGCAKFVVFCNAPDDNQMCIRDRCWTHLILVRTAMIFKICWKKKYGRQNAV